MDNETSQPQQPQNEAIRDSSQPALQQPTTSQAQTNTRQPPPTSPIPPSPTQPETSPIQKNENTNVIIKILGWYFFLLGPVSVITAVLSFLRSGDTFVEPLPYILFGVINLFLVVFYLKLSGKLRRQGSGKKVGLVMLPISLVILAISFHYLYSLVLSFI